MRIDGLIVRSPRVRLAFLVALLLAGAALIVLDWPATLTDEDEYMPFALQDVLHGDDPYATTHEGAGVIARPWGDQEYSWSTAYPYLPMLMFLQIPGIDYRWIAMGAYGALLLALRRTTWGFWAFANPLVVWGAASGFNDFVPLALLAWSTRVPWLAWVASASKQLMLPLVALDGALRRDARPFLRALAFTLIVSAPFLLWDPGAFLQGVLGAHLDKVADAYSYWNYWLYPLYALAVIVPASRKGYGGDTPAGSMA